MSNSVDREKLIQAVQKRPALYDKTEQQTYGKPMGPIANLWDAIKAELEVNGDGKNSAEELILQVPVPSYVKFKLKNA